LEGEHSQAAVDDLATEYLEAIRAVQPVGPYQFVGMCRGAHIGYEMARRLERAGEQVAFVGIVDSWVLENTYNRFLYVGYYARRLRMLLGLRRKEQMDLIRRKTRGESTTRKMSDSQRETAKLRANPMKAYFPGPDFEPKTYGGRVSVFRAHRQPLNRIRDKELGWGKLAAGGVDLHYVPGRHGQSVLSEPHVQVLAAKVKDCLLNSNSVKSKS